jgi:hypothetical protein
MLTQSNVLHFTHLILFSFGGQGKAGMEYHSFWIFQFSLLNEANK